AAEFSPGSSFAVELRRTRHLRAAPAQRTHSRMSVMETQRHGQAPTVRLRPRRVARPSVHDPRGDPRHPELRGRGPDGRDRPPGGPIRGAVSQGESDPVARARDATLGPALSDPGNADDGWGRRGHLVRLRPWPGLAPADARRRLARARTQ